MSVTVTKTKLVWDLGTARRFIVGVMLIFDRRVSLFVKILPPLLALLYWFSPIDAIPDFIPIIGQIDDVSIVGLLLFSVSLLPFFSPRMFVEEHARKIGIS
jgi:uncharacterized membrane protein YkvA (DUF1232 family)